MSKVNTVVFDNNALISAAILKSSIPAKALDVAISKCRVIVSLDTLFELHEVIFRKKFDKYISQEDRETFLNYFLVHSFEVQITSIITDCRDYKDNKYLELAVDGKADCIVTGDKDLLILNPFRNIPIITPAIFLEKFLD